MTEEGDLHETAGDAWEGTDEFDDEEREELERLRAKLGFRNGAPPRLIDQRYEVLGVLGNGGMGMVYRVLDRKLDRPVALKLVRHRTFRDDERLHERLEREAKALAKLDDQDHVVQVFEVDRDGDRLYFTMPYIEGMDLHAWQSQQERSCEEILTIYLQAARGLAAAHEQGIVHRDFKPANVLIRAKDRRAFVADFGIAEAISKVDTPPEGLEAVDIGDARLTATGGVMGTLPYVAPERIPGPDRPPRQATPASDQFSFCVALWEALAGQVPYPAKDISELLQRVEQPPQGETEIPTWLRKPLRRGMAVDPSARFPSMKALIHELERRWLLRRRGRLFLPSVGALVLMAGLGIGLWPGELILAEAEGSCEVFAEVAEQSWGEAQRDALMRHREQSPATIDEAVETIDERMTQWVAAGEALCVDAKAPQAASPQVDCLDRWLEAMNGTLGLLAKIDGPEMAGRAGDLVDRLGVPKHDCEQLQVDAGVWDLAERARAAALLGAGDEALTLAERALIRAIELGEGHGAELTEAWAAKAEVLARTQPKNALSAFDEVEIEGDLSNHLSRRLEARALAAKIRVINGEALTALQELAWARKLLARGIREQAQRRRLEAILEDAEGFVHYRIGDYSLARDHHQLAIEHLESADEPLLLAKALANLGNDLSMLDEVDAARRAYQRGVDVLAQAEISVSNAISLDLQLGLGLLEVDLGREQAFAHLEIVALHGTGARQLQALSHALSLAVNLRDRARATEFAAQLEPLVGQAVTGSEKQHRAQIELATALLWLDEPRGHELFNALLGQADDDISPELGLGLRKSYVRVLEEKGDCQRAGQILVETDAYARRRELVEDEFLEWRHSRVNHDCEHAPFINH